MTTEQLTAGQLIEIITQVYQRHAEQVDAEAWLALEEAARRLKRLERLAVGVMPDLRAWLSQLDVRNRR